MFSVLNSESSDDTLRKPRVSVQFDAAGGVAASLSSFTEAGDTLLDNLVAVDSGCSMSAGADYVHLLYSWSDSLAVEVDKEGEVGLGFGDGEIHTVMKGVVTQLRQGINGLTRVTLSNAGAVLARLRVNQAYEQQSAGDVVTDLAQRAGIEIDTADSGIDLAYFVVDDRSSVAQHLSTLALACDFVTYVTAQNTLYFGPANQEQAVKTFTYGANLLQASARRSRLPLGSVRAIGEGAAGSDGQDAWCWLLKQRDAVTTELGDGDAGRIVYSGAWRSADASASAAAGRLAAVQKLALRGRLLALGAPEVAVGNVIDVEDAHQADINGHFLVTAVKHHYSKSRGYVSEISFCESAASVPGGLF